MLGRNSVTNNMKNRGTGRSKSVRARLIEESNVWAGFDLKDQHLLWQVSAVSP